MIRPEKTQAPHEHTILVVDDDPEIVKLLSRILSSEQYNVTDARNGREALQKIENGGIDLVVLDLVMPEIGGIDTLREIANIAPQLAVVVLTGHGNLRTAREAMLLGAYEYITKPFDADFVRAAVKKTLENRAAGNITMSG